MKSDDPCLGVGEWGCRWACLAAAMAEMQVRRQADGMIKITWDEVEFGK